MIRGQLFHICLLFLTVKKMFGGNIQNITIWVDMAYLVNLKIILSFVFNHKIPMLFLHYHHKHGIMQQQVMERRL